MTISNADLLDLFAHEAALERAKLVPEATLADLGISSLDLVTLLFELEQKYGVVIEEGEMPALSTLGEMLDWLLARLDAALPADG